MTHKSSVDMFRHFYNRYLANKSGFDIYEIGSGGKTEYRDIIHNHKYVSVDIEGNPDIVLSDPYNWTEIEDSVANVVICGQVMEHVRYPWVTIREIARIMKKNGVCFVIAPSRGPIHPHPKDCWRFLPDGMESLLMWAKLRVLEFGFSPFVKEGDKWGDCYAIGAKQ